MKAVITLLGLKIYRIVFIIISYCLLSVIPDSSTTFFKAISIFCAGLFYDYISMLYNSEVKYQKIVSVTGMFFSLLFMVLGILGILGIIELDGSKVYLISSRIFIIFKFKIEFITYMRCMAILPLMAGLELFNKHKRANLYKAQDIPA